MHAIQQKYWYSRMELSDCPPFRASYGLEVPKKLLKTCSGPLAGSKLYPAQPVPERAG